MFSKTLPEKFKFKVFATIRINECEHLFLQCNYNETGKQKHLFHPGIEISEGDTAAVALTVGEERDSTEHIFLTSVVIF